MTIYGRRDLAPPRRRRHTGRRALVTVLVLVVLAGGGYAGWHFTHTGSSGPANAASHRRCVTPAAPPSPVAARQLRVRVMNTTLRTGLAARVRRILRRRGFRVTAIGNTKPKVRGVVIRYPGATSTPDAAAVTLREQFPGAAVRPGGRRGSYEVDLGRGFRSPASAHAAASRRAADERRAHPSPSCQGSAA